MVKNVTLFFIFIPFLLWGKEETSIKRSINFSKITQPEALPENFGYYSELKKWANFQNMYLQKDSRKGNIHDGMCRMLPSEGFEFYLEANLNQKARLFLYLDLTTYEAKEDSKFPTRSLSIYIGGKSKKVVFFRPGSVAENPALVPIDPEDIQAGRINIKLIPDHTEGGMFWGIWDAYYTTEKEKP